MATIPDGTAVWVKDTAKDSKVAFVKAEVVQFTEGRGYTVKTAAGEERTVRPVDCSPANPEGMSAPDNCYLIHISESTILDNMKMRFADKKIYTYTANILIAVNPFQSLTIYGHEHMSPYVNKPLGLLEPHVYAMAEEAYKSMLRSKASQSLVVSGESGAGKTETNKHLMNYLTFRSKSETVGSDIGNVILQANPVLEAFGNAKTSRNNNSSRFGKFVKVSFGETGGILGASTQQYLLEKSRVPFQSKGERNYHVFYDVVAGYADPAALGLDQGTASFHYLNQSGVTEISGVDDRASYAEVRASMGNIGLPETEQEAICVLLASLLHIGNVRFDGEDEAAVEAATKPSLERAASMLGAAGLEQCLVSSTMTTRGETFHVKLNKEKASLARDALTKSIYARLFDWMVTQINKTMKGSSSEEQPFIGLLDVYGFESFAINTFEQLCINFANEKLHQFFLKFVFKAEEDLYASEAVSWTKIEYQDNQGCIDLIEKSPTGIMRLLDEKCKQPGSDAEKKDKAFCTAVDETHRRNDFFMDARTAGRREFRTDEAFAVRHFAGDVCYVGANFVDKNNDTLHNDFVQLCATSSLPLLATLYTSESDAKKASSFNSVSRRFINDLNALMVDLNSTKAHFTRCIKPNSALQPFEFTPALCLTQLRCSGTIDAVQLMAGAYPTRIPYDSIYSRYASQMPDFVRKLEPPLFCEALALALDIPSASFALGRTKIFFKAGKGQVLEELAERDLSEVIPMLVEKIRQWEERKKMQIKLQKTARMFLERRRFKRMKTAARMIQHRARGRVIWIEYRKRHLAWLARREREEAERKKREAEEKARREEEERKRQEEAAAQAKAKRRWAMATAAAAEDVAGRQKAEADAYAAKLVWERAIQAAKAAAAGLERAKNEVAVANMAVSAHALTEEQIADIVAAERAAATDKALEQEEDEFGGDTVLEVDLAHGDSGLGINLDDYGDGATVGYIAPDGVVGRDGRVRVGDKIFGVNGHACDSYDDVVARIKGSMPKVAINVSRSKVRRLLEGRLQMEYGTSGDSRAWEDFTFRLFSDRTLTFEKSQPPVVTGQLEVHLALEVRTVDAPNGGGYLEIETASKSFALRSSESKTLHLWQRELYRLMPFLRATEVKSGWLLKKGSRPSSGFRRYFCVLFSSHRLLKMLCFDSETCTKRKNTVDLSAARSVEHVSIAKGHGFQIMSPSRRWIFATEAADEMSAWVGTLVELLDDLREREKQHQPQADGGKVLKEGWADLKDASAGAGVEQAEAADEGGSWASRWFALSSDGLLNVYLDAESSAMKRVLSVDLKGIERIERSKGTDYYDFCIDLIGASAPTRMRLIDRAEMQAWLGALQTQLSALASKTSGDTIISTILHGWLDKRGTGGGEYERRFFVLCAHQKQTSAEKVELHHYLNHFDSEAAAELNNQGVPDLDLAAVSEVRMAHSNSIQIATKSFLWQLRAESPSDQETWFTMLRAIIVGPSVPSGQHVSSAIAAPHNVTTTASARLMMQLPGPGEQPVWKGADFKLQSDGVLRWRSEEAWPWDAGAIDVKRALGMWLLGPPGWRRLEVIMPEQRWTLAAPSIGGDGGSGGNGNGGSGGGSGDASGEVSGEAVLERWIKLLEDVVAEKPVSEIRNGWMEKKSADESGWKVRFFVLLSTQELLYFESDRSPRCKGVFDLKEATACRRVASPDYNYEAAFEVVAPQRTWVLCPDDEETMQQWMDAIAPLLTKRRAFNRSGTVSLRSVGNRNYDSGLVGESEWFGDTALV